jgi:hypothetical protein
MPAEVAAPRLEWPPVSKSEPDAHPRRAEAPDRTRVELEHRNLDRHGPDWESERDGVGGDQGWPLYLERFAEKVNA